MNSQVVVNQSQTNADTAYIGTINAVDGVRTYSDQTYRANLMSAQSDTQPGGVTFSVWDPEASVNFNLPVQTASNSACSINCGQLNLQNPNSRDMLTIDGSTNFGLDPNLSGVNNWGNEYVQNRALGYIPPVVPPIVRPLAGPTYVPAINGGVLRQALDFHADQVQMTVDARILEGGVTVSESGVVNETPKSTVFSSVRKGSKAKLDLAGTATICSVDEKGEESCGED